MKIICVPMNNQLVFSYKSLGLVCLLIKYILYEDEYPIHKNILKLHYNEIILCIMFDNRLYSLNISYRIFHINKWKSINKWI